MTPTAIRATGLNGDVVDVDAHALERLAARLAGPILRPGDAGFEAATRIWNGMVDRTPALVVQPLSPDEVREAVRFARATGILLSVKGGGHNIAGTSLADRGLTLDMSRMRDVEVDPERRIARVGPGCLLRNVDIATQEHGLATVLGIVSETGVAGPTLGGGFGYLSRRFGWAVDNLEEVEIVTAEGESRRAAPDEHGDLFWALRGGGGNFGIVTRFVFRLHAVGPEVTAGAAMWEAEDAGELLRLYRDLATAAPRELTLALMVRLAPAARFVSERWHGKPVVVVIACHTGEAPRAAEDLAALRTVRKPIADVIVRTRYVEQQAMFDAMQPRGTHNYWKTEFLSGLSDELLETFLRQRSGMASPMSQLMIFQLGGAIADRDPTATSCANRDAEAFFASAGCWVPGVPEQENEAAWARGAWEAMRPYSTGGNYVNAQTPDEDESRLTAAFGDNLERLAKVKAAYDLENLFRVNRNIAPAA